MAAKEVDKYDRLRVPHKFNLSATKVVFISIVLQVFVKVKTQEEGKT